jgi:diguanylate cyclase (GGDEF)-like protein
MRNLLIRLGPLRSTLALTFLSILIAVSLTVAINALMGKNASLISLWIAVIVPAIIAPVYSLPFMRLLIRLDGAEKRLHELTRRDALTGLYSRTYFIELAEREMERTLRYGEPFSIIVLDIDGFKVVNEIYGHPAGDKVLKVFSQVILDTLRQSDVVARFGGDEFVTLLPNTSAKNVQACIERIHKVLQRTSIVHEGSEIRFTACAGTATYCNLYIELDMILQQADKALCQAKSLGKNQFVISD